MNKAVNEWPRTGNYEGKSRNKTKEIISIGMFAAVLAVLSQISIPMPSGVPVTLQTFAVALIGAVLGWPLAASSVCIYILLGAVGIPVFSGLRGGLQVLVGPTGGFIWGFLIMAAFCGVGARFRKKPLAVLCGCAGLAVCHLFGICQFTAVAGKGFLESFLLVSAPYLAKDALSVLLAFIAGTQIRTRLARIGLL